MWPPTEVEPRSPPTPHQRPAQRNSAPTQQPTHASHAQSNAPQPPEQNHTTTSNSDSLRGGRRRKQAADATATAAAVTAAMYPQHAADAALLASQSDTEAPSSSGTHTPTPQHTQQAQQTQNANTVSSTGYELHGSNSTIQYHEEPASTSGRPMQLSGAVLPLAVSSTATGTEAIAQYPRLGVSQVLVFHQVLLVNS